MADQADSLSRPAPKRPLLLVADENSPEHGPAVPKRQKRPSPPPAPTSTSTSKHVPGQSAHGGPSRRARKHSRARKQEKKRAKQPARPGQFRPGAPPAGARPTAAASPGGRAEEKPKNGGDTPTHEVLRRLFPERLLTLRQFCYQRLAELSREAGCPFEAEALRKSAVFVQNLSAASRVRGKNIVQVLSEANWEALQFLLDRVLVGVEQRAELARQAPEGTEPDRSEQLSQFRSMSQPGMASTQQLGGEGSLAESITNVFYGYDELVNFVIWKMFQQNSPQSKQKQPAGGSGKPSLRRARPSHILCLGYAHNFGPQAGAARFNPASRDRDAAELATGLGFSFDSVVKSSIPGLVELHANEHLEAVRASTWKYIFFLLGKAGRERVLVDLLESTCVFAPLETKACLGSGGGAQTGGYYQISGTPIHLLTHLEAGTKGDSGSKEHSLGEITISRAHILYAQPAINKKGDVKFGINHAFIFNRLKNVESKPETVHLLKYIFPQEFGLESPLTPGPGRTPATGTPPPDYTFREAEIREMRALGKDRDQPSRRLRGRITEVTASIRRRHQKCAYKALLDHYCPPAPAPTLATDPDKDGWIFDGATSQAQVVSFCKAVITHIFPAEVWGSPAEGRFGPEPSSGVAQDPRAFLPDAQQTNKKKVMGKVALFVQLRRFERITLHDLLEGIQLRALDWLGPAGHVSGQAMSRPEYVTRRRLMASFLFFVFNSFLPHLIRSHFYVTEGSLNTVVSTGRLPEAQNNLFFFRQDVWRDRTSLSLSFLKKDKFRELPRDQTRRMLGNVRSGAALKSSFSIVGAPIPLRLQPKASSGVRPIVNLSRKIRPAMPAMPARTGAASAGPSPNKVLRPLLWILQAEIRDRPWLLGSGIMSPPEVVARVNEFRERVQRAHGGEMPQLFFAKADVKSCFDSLPQKEIIDTVKGVLRAPAYRIHRYVRLKAVAGVDGEREEEQSEQEPGGVALPLFPQEKPRKDFLASIVPVRPGEDDNVSFVERAKAAKGNPACASSVQSREGAVLVDSVIPWREVSDPELPTLPRGTIPKPVAMRLLRKHVRHTLIAARLTGPSPGGNGLRRRSLRVYRQVRGIPQGSVLSSWLCGLLYGRFEREALPFLNQSPPPAGNSSDRDEDSGWDTLYEGCVEPMVGEEAHTSLLLRLTDDFLVISTSKAIASQFLKVMHAGSRRYGIAVRPEKSLANFPCTVASGAADGAEPTKIPIVDSARARALKPTPGGGQHRSFFPYCGLHIDTATLAVRKLPGLAVAGGPGENAGSIYWARRPGQEFYRRVLSNLRIRLAASGVLLSSAGGGGGGGGDGCASRVLGQDDSQSVRSAIRNIRDAVFDTLQKAVAYWAELPGRPAGGAAAGRWRTLARTVSDASELVFRAARRVLARQRRQLSAAGAGSGIGTGNACVCGGGCGLGPASPAKGADVVLFPPRLARPAAAWMVGQIVRDAFCADGAPATFAGRAGLRAHRRRRSRLRGKKGRGGCGTRSEEEEEEAAAAAAAAAEGELLGDFFVWLDRRIERAWAELAESRAGGRRRRKGGAAVGGQKMAWTQNFWCRTVGLFPSGVGEESLGGS